MPSVQHVNTLQGAHGILAPHSARHFCQAGRRGAAPRDRVELRLCMRIKLLTLEADLRPRGLLRIQAKTYYESSRKPTAISSHIISEPWPLDAAIVVIALAVHWISGYSHDYINAALVLLVMLDWVESNSLTVAAS